MSNINYNFNKLTPFKFFCLTNFPFIEEDFDSLTTYELLCKVVEYLNKVIDTTNTMGTQTEELTNAFNELKSYVDNYFDNLDVQNEINNKLNEMAESGQLTDIIAQYLQLAGVLAYDTKTAMKTATNLVNGSITKTLGNSAYSDGQGAFYKVRQIQNTDLVDDENIIALSDPDLVAEKIPYSSGYDLQNQITTNTNAIADINDNRSILLSDSYFDYSPDGTIPDGQKYWQSFFKMENITDYQGFNAGGIGFYQKVGDVNFLQLLKNNSNNIQNKDTVKNIFVFGGYNDAFDNNTTILNIKQSISDFVAYCKETYPNAKVFIGEIGYDTNFTNDGTTRRNKINNKVVPAYSDTAYNSNTPFIYLPNLEYCLHNRDYMSSDGIHPNIAGHNALANAIHSAYHNGFNQLPFNEEYVTALPIDGNTQEHTAVSLYVKNDIPTKNIRFNQFIISFTENYPTLSSASGTSVCKITNSKTIIPVYDIPVLCHLLLSFTDNTYIIVPGKITFAQNGDLTVTAYELNESKTGWKELPNVKYIQAFDFDFTCSMNVL